MERPSVTLLFSQAILRAAERLGLRLPVSLPASARVPLAFQDELWSHFCRETDDPLAPLQFGLALQVGQLDMVGVMLMSAGTFGESLRDFLTYLPLIGEGGDFSLRLQGDHALVCYRPRFRVCRAQRVEAVLGAFVHFTQWNTDGRVRVERVCFRHQPLDDPMRYVELLGCSVSFGARENRIEFGADQLQVPLLQANAELRDHLRRLADDKLRELDGNRLAARVAELVRECPDWNREQVSQCLAISPRHLSRRLAEEGTSFRALRDRELRALAESLLRREGSIAAIAEGLGFADESAFAKAFRRWTGLSPGQFRRR